MCERASETGREWTRKRHKMLWAALLAWDAWEEARRCDWWTVDFLAGKLGDWLTGSRRGGAPGRAARQRVGRCGRPGRSFLACWLACLLVKAASQPASQYPSSSSAADRRVNQGTSPDLLLLR